MRRLDFLAEASTLRWDLDNDLADTFMLELRFDLDMSPLERSIPRPDLDMDLEEAPRRFLDLEDLLEIVVFGWVSLFSRLDIEGDNAETSLLASKAVLDLEYCIRMRCEPP